MCYSCLADLYPPPLSLHSISPRPAYPTSPLAPHSTPPPPHPPRQLQHHPSRTAPAMTIHDTTPTWREALGTNGTPNSHATTESGSTSRLVGIELNPGPVELYRDVLHSLHAFLELVELLACSGVCRMWNAAAVSSPYNG